MWKFYGFVTCLAACGRIGFNPAIEKQTNTALDAGASASFDADAIALDAMPEAAPLPTGLAIEWSQGYEGSSVRQLAIDPLGNIYIAGGAIGPVDLGGGDITGGGDTDVFVASYSPEGTHRWSQLFGGDTRFDSVGGIVVSGAELIVAGAVIGTVDFGGGPISTTNDGVDAFVAHLQTDSGRHLASNLLGGANSEKILAVCTTSTGFAHTGQYTGVSNFGGDDLLPVQFNEFYVAEYEGDDTHLWSRSAPGSGNQVGNAIVSHNGNVIVGGYFQSSTDFGDGSVTATGTDAFVASYDQSGSFRWQFLMPTLGFAQVSSIAVAANGNLFIGGRFVDSPLTAGETVLQNNGESDAFLVSLDSNGNHRWSRSYGGSGSDRIDALAVDALGNLYLTGQFEDTMAVGDKTLSSAGAYDMFVSLHRDDGSAVWAANYGSASNEQGTGVAITPEGEVIVVVHYGGQLDFGTGPLPPGNTSSNTALVKFTLAY